MDIRNTSLRTMLVAVAAINLCAVAHAITPEAARSAVQAAEASLAKAKAALPALEASASAAGAKAGSLQAALDVANGVLREVRGAKKPDADAVKTAKSKVADAEKALAPALREKKVADEALAKARKGMASIERDLADANAALAGAEKSAAEAKAKADRKVAEAKARAEADAAKAEAEAKVRAEKERVAAEKKAKVEAEKLAKAEAEAKARAEKERVAAEKKAKAEAEKLAKTEAEAKARAEKERVAAEKKAKAEAEKLAKAEAEAKARAEKAAAADAKGTAEAAPAAKAPAKSAIENMLAEKAITVKGDTEWFDNAHVRDGRSLSKVFADALSQTNVQAAAAIVQKEARDNGYYLCVVGTSKDGRTVDVEAGRFSQIDIHFGDDGKTEGRWFTSSQIREKLERAMVRSGEPFNYHVLYSQFRDLNSNPDLAANIELRLPNDGDDGDGRALGVDVNVKEAWPVHAVFGIDNYGTDASDNWTGRATIQRLNLWKMDHALTLNGFSALNGSLYGGAGSYYIPFEAGSRDAALTIHGGASTVDAEEVVRYIDVEGDGYFYGMQGSVELLDSTRDSLRLALGVTFHNTKDCLVLHDEGQRYKQNENGVDIIPLSLALMYSSRDLDSLMGRTYATVEGVVNIGGSSDDEIKAQRAEAEKDYWLVRAQLARIQTIGGQRDVEKGWSGRSMLFCKLDAQYAGGALIPAEQMAAGGANSVRGYKEREYLGDHAAVATLEYRTPLYLGLATRPAEGKTAQDRLQFVVFTDIGGIWREDALPGEDDHQFLWGAGVGVRFAWSDYLQFRADYALPLEETNESAASDGGAVHISIQAQF